MNRVAEDKRQPAETKSPIVEMDPALYSAIHDGDYITLKRLLHSDADLNARNTSGKTTVHMALEQRDLGLLETLVPFQPDLNLKTPDGKTPLHIAVFAEWEDAVKLLLRSDIDINATDDDGNTALHLACMYKDRDIARLLLQSGADMHILNSNEQNAIDIATASRTRWLQDLLLQHGERLDIRHREDLVHDDSQSSAREDGIARISHEIQQELPDTAELSYLGSILAQFGGSHWDGVRRENGDGFILATYDNHDVFFDAKLESIRLVMHEGQEMHAIQLKLNFMKPFSTRNRIRYAKVDAKLAAINSGQLPHIHNLMPQADRVEVSEQEISSGQTFTVGASGSGGPSNVNISMEGSKSRKSTFKGVRVIHGVVKDKMHATWRMYEEPGSQSGLPEIVRLLLLVQCQMEFGIRVSMSVKACHFSSFGIPRTLNARAGQLYRVPNVNTMVKLEQAMKLKGMLDVADLAATTVQEAALLKREFTRSIQNHDKKALIMEAGSRDDFVQDWADIVDASRLGDFSVLHEKLMQMELAKRRARASEPIHLEPEGRYSQIEVEETRRYRSQPSSRRGERRIDFDEVEGQYDRNEVKRMAERSVSRERAYRSHARDALESFSAVGPGYKVSRLA